MCRLLKHRDASPTRAALEAALCVTALLPVTNVIVAQVTRAYFPRYSLPAVVGISVLLALTLEDLWLTPAGQAVFAVVLACIGVDYMYGRILQAEFDRDVLGGNSVLSPAQRKMIAGSSDPHVYMQDVAQFLVHHYYAPVDSEPTLKGFYSAPCELYWRHRDPGSLFAYNMQQTAHLPFQSFRDLVQQPGPHFLVVYHDPGEEWIELELQAQHASTEFVGHALGGDLLRVTFSETPTCEPQKTVGP